MKILEFIEQRLKTNYEWIEPGGKRANKDLRMMTAFHYHCGNARVYESFEFLKKNWIASEALLIDSYRSGFVKGLRELADFIEGEGELL